MGAPSAAPIHGRDGDLVSLRVATDVRHVEDLLEALSAASFPVNPQLWHQTTEVVVEFPVWERDLDELRRLLRDAGFERAALEIRPALAGFESHAETVC